MNRDEIDAGLAPTPSYRYADVVGDQLFVAGQVPLDESGTLVGVGDAKLQASTALDNLAVLLTVHGFDRADIRQLTVYVAGEHQLLLDAWAAVTAWFDDEVPPATLLGVTCLGYGEQLVEFDATILRRRADD